VAPSVQCRKVWLTPTRNPLKFAGVPQTRQQISATSGPSSPYCQDTWGRYCCLTSFFQLSIRALVAKTEPYKIVRWCPNGDFLTIFWVLHFQRAARSTFQTCILNSHYGHTMCQSMVDIQSATAEIRRVKKERRRKKPQGKNIMAAIKSITLVSFWASA